jgi:thiol-disulfide isomerase/thioredoxin
MRLLFVVTFGWLLLGAALTHGGTVAGPKPVGSVVPIDENGLTKLIGESKGRVVLVNFWATWCVPCVEEFPDLLKVRERYRHKGLDVLFVSADDPKHADREVIAFLKRLEVDFTTYIKQTKDDDSFINAVSPKWSGALPATFIFDRKGKLVHTRIDAQTFEVISRLVEPLLAR